MADENAFNMAQRPLASVVICCTSIPPEKRSDLASIAAQMGATHKLDLTSDVTHLIVGDTDTPKYKYVAKERPDVKCLLPEWVDAVRQSWMEGGDTDVEALELQYRLPTFAGLRVCVTGFEDLVIRKRLEDTVKTNGGEYRGDLSKEVTHLIALKPAGKKYEFAKTWGIRVVSVEWLQQSLERGMILDESLYDPILEPGRRGENAWVRRTVSTSVLSKRTREDDNVAAPARKLRRTASAKGSIQQDGMWTDIVGGGSAANEEKHNDEWDDNQRGLPPRKLDIKSNAWPKPLAFTEEEKHSTEIMPTQPQREDGVQAKRGLFFGKSFFLHGFDARKTGVIEHHLRSHGAEILPDLNEFAQRSTRHKDNSSFVLVPHTSSERDIPSTQDPIPPSIVVTDMWIELCLHKKRYIQPEDNITNSPFRYPIPGFKGLTICCTAFEGIELLQVSKVIKLMGASFDEYLTDDISVLICNDCSLSRDKIRHALEWGVPAVKSEWLWDCLRSGRRKPYDNYLIHPDKQALRTRSDSTDSRRSTSTDKKDSVIENVTKSEHGSKCNRIPSEVRTSPGSKDASFVRHVSVEARSFKVTAARDTFEPIVVADLGMSVPQDDNVTRFEQPTTPSFEQRDHPTALQELSTNSPPKPAVARTKSFKSNSSCTAQLQNDSLTTAISSLLAHHKRPSSNTPPAPPSELPLPGRRKRKLFGRAPSNLSACSASSVGLSRASSVDTLNTDGLGTPLEASHPMPAKPDNNNNKDILTASLLATSDELADSLDAKQDLPMTQLGYEDPEAGAWRERLVSRMGGGKGKVATPKAKGIGTVRDTRLGAQSVSRRTRQAGGR